jgi:hypothetical protein
MNALYLKDLAQKTRRGLEGPVRQGRSGGGLCYGYESFLLTKPGAFKVSIVSATIRQRTTDHVIVRLSIR